jgi:hypothetical protein
MPRTLPKNKSNKQRLIIKAVYDYFGNMTSEEEKRANQMALWLMNRRRGVNILSEEHRHLQDIRTNLEDKIYVASLTSDL